MTYDDIDKVLLPWASRKQLKVFTIMRDDPIRLLTIRDKRGDLSVDPSDDPELIMVRATKGHERFDRIVPLSDLSTTLDDAYVFLNN